MWRGMEPASTVLTGRLSALCRACLTAPASVDLDAECAVPGATVRLHVMLSRVTHTQLKKECGLPSGLCDGCLAACVRAFTFVTSYARAADALRRSLLSISKQLERHDVQSTQPLYLRCAPDAIGEAAHEEYSEPETQAARFNCSMCALSFTTLLLLKRHTALHPAGTDHICRHCGNVYKNKTILKRHIAAKHGKPQVFQCDACGKTYASAVGLGNHRATQHPTVRLTHIEITPDPNARKLGKRGGGHVCEICAKKFSRPSELQRHKRSKHTALDCPQCGKSFKVRSYYEAHVKKHTRTKEECKIHRCEHCAYSTDKKFLLTCHTRRRHTHVRPYACELCGKCFYIRREVTLHMSVHTKARPEKCPLCDKRFVNKTALLYHRRLHTGERPYACEQCGERFLSSSRRGAHVRSRHRPRPQCPLCNATFTDNQVLKKHIKNVHSEQQPKSHYAVPHESDGS